MLGNLSVVHVLLLLIIVAMIFGTSRLKNIGRDLGGAIQGFKEAMREGEQASTPQQAPSAKLSASEHDPVPPVRPVETSSDRPTHQG